MRWVWVFATAILLAIAAPAWAEEAWPQRPVTIVVPFQAGGSADLLARILQQHMEADFHSPFVVENRSGAGGSVGTAYVAKAPNDGYTLLLGTLSGNVLNEFVFSKLSYDPERDFQPSLAVGASAQSAGRQSKSSGENRAGIDRLSEGQ